MPAHLLNRALLPFYRVASKRGSLLSGVTATHSRTASTKPKKR
jgi:hypothetical protein